METDLINLFVFPLITTIEWLPLTLGTFISMLVLFILLMCSAMLSGSEVAFFSLNPSDLQYLEDKNTRSGKLILKHLKKPEQLLATILIGNNFVNVGIVILAAFITPSLIKFGEPLWVQFAVEVIGITSLILFFGEIMPKVYASRFSRNFAEIMSYPVLILKVVFSPLSAILVKSTSFVNKKMGNKTGTISLDDLSHALQLTSDEITDEKELLEGIVKFGNISAAEIMKARVDVIDIDITADYNKVLAEIVEWGYSRMPIFENTPDNVKGVLYVKDLLPHLDCDKDFKWQELIRTPYFVPETKKIDDLLEEFQLNKIHMAIVVDEYGGTSGIVTLEDILEEIVGEISDENDEDESFYVVEPDGSIIFEGKILLNDFHKVTEIDEAEFEKVKGEAETLAGLILEIKGEMPEKNDRIRYGDYLFTVVAVDMRRIRKLRFEKKPVN
ncbi:gliding motility-associated protein GldE [Saccharicrinis carchari]|uniref:Gliding motility-associated protein GldE n=1 Tax=Saccharicrinis carchari TaxID=1168039 RepID=A0A521CE64_SACCC|nr:gliding motility-associated protein GldE [Saccharicrinis carchari]SMO57723.1 gliding motility-associated protein GldE [Saccharicrinis carchari]